MFAGTSVHLSARKFYSPGQWRVKTRKSWQRKWKHSHMLSSGLSQELTVRPQALRFTLSRLRFTACALIVVHVKDPRSICFDKGSSNVVHVKGPLPSFPTREALTLCPLKIPGPSFSTREALTMCTLKIPVPSFSTKEALTMCSLKISCPTFSAREALTIGGRETHVTHDSRIIIEMWIVDSPNGRIRRKNTK